MASNQRSEVRSQRPEKKDSTKAAANDVFAKPLEAKSSLPAPRAEAAPQPLAPPPVGSDVSATLTATLTPGAGGDVDGDGKADPGDTIKYTATLTSSGAGATGLSFSNPLDSHTTLVPGSLNSTPVAFDQSVSLNEDATLVITLQGQDPDGSNVTFKDSAGNPFPSNPTTIATTHGTIGSFGSVSCDANGLCSQQVTYTPAADYNGSDSFNFKANDGTANSNENGTVSITVNPVNDAPTFTVPSVGQPPAVNEDAGAQTVSNFITNVRPGNTTDTLENGQTVNFVITNNTNPGLFQTAPALNVVGASYPKTATLTYTSAANQNGTATISYHAHDNGGTSPGVDTSTPDQTFTITVNAVNDPPVVVAPNAYSAQANMKITGLTGLLGNVNDNADNGVNGCVSTTFTVTSGSISGTTAHGGTVSNVNLNTGTFDYDPPAGYTGADTFTYTVSDTGCPGVAVSTPATTVTINVAGPVIWFVNTTLGPAGNGTLLAPFNNLDAVTNSVTGKMGINANQRVFVFSGSTTAVGTTTTLAGNNSQANQALAQAQAQWLIGQGTVAASFDSFFGITPPAGTIARPTLSSNATTANGMRPTIRGTVTMKENTVVEGLNINTSAGATKGLTASGLAAGTSGSLLTIKDVSVTSAAGNAVDIAGASATNNSVEYTTSDTANSPNVLVAGNGSALSVVNTTIGANGLSFKSITSSGGSNNGITLDTTGSSGGGLTVYGDNSNTTVGGNSTGGTISNKSGADGSTTTGSGIYLNSTSNVVLRRMTINGTNQNFGVRGNNVTGFTFEYSTVNGTNGTINSGANIEGDIRFDNLLGSASVKGCTITGGAGHTFYVRNTSGTLNRLTVDTTTIGNQTLNSVTGLILELYNSATANMTVQESVFTAAQGNLLHAVAQNSGNMDVVVRRNKFSNNHPNISNGGGGVKIEGGAGAANNPTITYDVSCNTFRDAKGVELMVFKGNSSGGTFTGSIVNNKIGVTGVSNSGGASGIEIDANGKGTHTVLIQDNDIRRYNNLAGIYLSANDSGGAGGATLNATVFHNTTAEPEVNAFAGFYADLGAVNTDTNIMNVVAGSATDATKKNDFSAGDPANFSDVSLNRNQPSTTFNLYKNGSASGTAAGVIQDDNLNSGTTTVSITPPINLIAAGLPTAPPGVTSCTTITMLKRESGDRNLLARSDSAGSNATVDSLFAFLNSSLELPSVNSINSSSFIAPASVSGAAQPSLLAIGATVTAETASENRTAPQIASRIASSLSRVFNAVDALIVPTAYAETANKSEVRGQESEVHKAGVGSRESGVRRSNHAATAETSQRLEVKDQKSDIHLNHAASLMLGAGSSKASTIAAPFVPTPVGQFPINGTGNGAGFTLPAGKTTTITFKATLNNPPNLSGVPPGTPQVSAQGTLTGSFIGNPIVTDDPVPAGTTDPTVTAVDLFDTTTTLGAVPSAGSWNVGQSITFTATVAPNPANATTVTGTVIFKDGGVAISGCNGVTIVSGQAQCVTTFGSGAHSVQAFYSGDGNYDPSSSNTLSQGAVNQSATTTAVTSSANPSLVTQSVTFTATVTSNTGFTGPPTGTVQFKDNLVNLGSAQTLNGSGVATLTTSALIAGNHPITAVYSGDTNFATSTGTLTGNPQVVNKSNTTTALLSNANPSKVNQNVTFTGTVTSQTAVTGPPAGTLTFKADGNAITCSNGGTSVQTLVSGSATCQVATLIAGAHVITADYAGDGSANGSATFNTSSGTLSPNQQVDKSDTTTALQSSQNPSVFGSGVTFTATVTSQSSVTGPPAGKAQFFDGVNPITCTGGGESNTSTGETLNGSGVATCTTSTLSIASHNITATYTGDGSANGSATFNGSTSSILTQVVNPACTASITVMNTGDSGAGSLRQAITDVCDGGTITFDAVAFAAPGPYTINLSDVVSNELLVNKSVTITGPGASVLTVKRISGAVNNFRVFEIASGKTVAISGLTIANGHATGPFPANEGGGIFNDHGTLTLSNCVISGNTADDSGGGLFNNALSAGSSSATIQNCTFASNTASTGGGAVYNYGDTGTATATISNSTFSGNTVTGAGGAGGALDNFSANAGTANLLVSNSTISGNTSNGDAGGLVNNASTGTATATLTSVTITGNHSDNDDNASGDGGGINVLSGAVTLKNTIVAGNYKGSATTVASDVFGTVDPASSYNLIGDAVTSGGLTNGTNFNIVGNSGAGTINIATVLNPSLADNGGPTKTHALVNGSPALEKGNAFSLTTDQRGFARPVNYDSVAPIAPYDDTDIGAYELQVTPGAPNAPDLDATSDTGLSSTDNLTSDTSPTFTITGVTPGALVELLRDANPGTGTPQVETATVVGTITGTNQVETATVTTNGNTGGVLTAGGNASVTVTAAGMTGTPKTILVAVTTSDDDAGVAGKIRAALQADADIGDVTTGFFAISGSGTSIVLTKKVKAADDGSMNLSIDSCTCTGLDAAPTSANTTPGVAPGSGNATVTVTAAGMNNSPKTLSVAVVAGDDASAVAGKMRTALSADPDVSAFFTVSGSGADIVLTAKTAAANDGTLNIATANGTCTGLTNEPTSADTTAGAAGPVVVASGTAVGTSIQLTDPSVGSGQWLYTARQTVSGAPRSPQSASLLVTIDTSTPAAPDAPNLDDTSDTGTSNSDNLTNDTTPTFTIGNVTNGFTVSLLRDTVPTTGVVVVASGTAAGTSIQLTDPSAPQGVYVYTSRQSNGVNSTDSATGLTVTIDTTPPAAPGTPDLQAGSDTFGVGGTGTNSDNITSASSRAFDIPTTTNGIRVELYRDSTLAAFGTGNGGTLTLTDTSTPGDATYSYTARQVDAAGNFAASAGLSVKIDTTATAAGIPDLQPGSDSGPSNTDNYTNAASRSFDIPTTENGSLVELYRGATFIASTTGTGGTVTLTDNTSPGDGSYDYTSKQTDLAGNAASSNILTVTIDTTPNAPGTPNLQDASDTGASNSDNITGNATHSFDIASQNGDLVELLRNGSPVSSTTAAGASVTLSDSASLSDNVYHYTARQTDLAGNVATSAGTLDVTIDTTAPLVTSDVRASANPTSAASVDFTVTFTEDVTGVDLADFVAVGSGGVTGASVTTVTPVNAKVYTVTVNTGTGDGSLRLDVVNTDGATPIKDVMNLTLGAGFTSGGVYTIDRFNPYVTSITRAGSTPTNANSVDFTVTFSEPVTGVDNTDFALITSGLGGSPAVTGVSPAGPSATYTVSASTGTGSGTIKLKLNDNDSIIDAANKPLAPSPGTSSGDGSFTPTDGAALYTIDKTPPDVTINQAGTQADPVTGPTASTVIHFTAVFTKPVADFANGDVSITGTANASVVNVSQIAPNDGTTYDVAVEGMTQSGTVIASIASGVAHDSAGNGNTTGTFTDHTVTFFVDNFTTFEVNTTADTDDGQCAPIGTGNGCTLREAINAANTDAGAETITFNIPTSDPGYDAGTGVYTITVSALPDNLGALPTITTDMTVQGPGAKVLTIKRRTGAADFSIFNVNNSGTVTLSGLTITNGTGIAGHGGGVQNSSGTLNVTNCAISGNILPATSFGGGIYSTGTLNVTNSTISGNSLVSGAGGGIYSSSTLNVTNSTISGNSITSNGEGGGIYQLGGTATVISTTITGNSGGTSSSGGGIRSLGTVNVENSIVAGNSATLGPDVIGTFVSQGFNLIGKSDGSAGFTQATDQKGTIAVALDPQLNALADNGGPTMTHSLLCTSPAIDKGKAFGLTTDQRGGTRPFDFADAIFPNAAGGDGSDIGAFETQAGGGCVPEAQAPNPPPTTNEDNAVSVQLKAVYSQNVQMTFSIDTAPTNGSLGPITGTTCTFNLSTTCTANVLYTPNADYFGPDMFKFKAATNPGGLTSDPAEVDITVNSVNDPPSFFLGPNQNILEDAGPQTVANFANTISVGPANESGQTYQFILQTNTNPGLFSAAPALDNAGTLTYTPAANKNGSATLTFVMKDSGGGNDTSVPRTFTINVASVNDAPTFTKGPDLVVDENSPQQTITNWATAISPGPPDESAQTVNFKVTGFTNPGLFSIGPLLNSNGTLTFTPNPNSSGTSVVTLVLKDNGGTANGGIDTSAEQTFTITIREGGSLQFSSATYSVGESGGNAVITVTRTGGTGGTTSVLLATSDGTATAGSDYTAVSQTVTFNDGDTSKTVNVPITNDLINEPNETVNLTLSGITGSGELGAPSTAVLTINDDDPVGGYIKFSSANYSVAEGGIATITVQRTGTLTQAVTIDYATSDSSVGPQTSCAPTPGNTLASSRCDFTSAFGTITFGAGDGADKTFTVLINQDSYVEGPETLALTLSNPTGGANLVIPSTATLTINDDVSEPASNLVDDTSTFVEQLYRDFLNRPSDAPGKAFWVDNIDRCNDPARRLPGLTQAQCIEVQRINTAAAFFLSIEFQTTGGTAYLTNKAAFGSVPTFLSFEPDAQAIGRGYVFGQSGAEAILEANKVAYFNSFVARSSFTAIYGGLTNAQYVDALIANTGVSFTPAERNALVNGLNGATETRATVLRKVTEKASFRDAEFNRIFVLMEYFGFLRRDPDAAGFNFWLTKLNQFNGNYIAAEMIKAFISSAEYRGRFGP